MILVEYVDVDLFFKYQRYTTLVSRRTGIDHQGASDWEGRRGKTDRRDRDSHHLRGRSGRPLPLGLGHKVFIEG